MRRIALGASRLSVGALTMAAAIAVLLMALLASGAEAANYRY